MAVVADGHKVPCSIVSAMTAEYDMVSMKRLTYTTHLAAPVVPAEYFIPKQSVFLRV